MTRPNSSGSRCGSGIPAAIAYRCRWLRRNSELHGGIPKCAGWHIASRSGTNSTPPSANASRIVPSVSVAMVVPWISQIRGMSWPNSVRAHKATYRGVEIVLGLVHRRQQCPSVGEAQQVHCPVGGGIEAETVDHVRL